MFSSLSHLLSTPIEMLSFFFSFPPFSLSPLLPVEVDLNILFFLQPRRVVPSSLPFFPTLPLNFVSDITMHHAVVLFLCFRKVRFSSPCVSVARVSRTRL